VQLLRSLLPALVRQSQLNLPHSAPIRPAESLVPNFLVSKRRLEIRFVQVQVQRQVLVFLTARACNHRAKYLMQADPFLQAVGALQPHAEDSAPAGPGPWQWPEARESRTHTATRRAAMQS
jgi:hypothetical protein